MDKNLGELVKTNKFFKGLLTPSLVNTVTDFTTKLELYGHTVCTTINMLVLKHCIMSM